MKSAMRIFSRLIRLFFIALTMFVSQRLPRSINVKEMNTEQIKALDREKTVVLLPVGILEEHGPYLPSFSDGYITERRTENLANAIVEKPGWKVLIFPIIPLGTEIPPPAEPNIVGKTFTQHNQEIETKQQEWLKQKGLE